MGNNNGENKIGLCIHKMIGGELDNGDIIARDFLKIDLGTKVTDAWNWMTNRTPSLYLEALKALEKDHNFENSIKDPEKALRCLARRPEDGRIDWHQSATTIDSLMPATLMLEQCSYKEKPLIIWDAEVASDENFMAKVRLQTLVKLMLT